MWMKMSGGKKDRWEAGEGHLGSQKLGCLERHEIRLGQAKGFDARQEEYGWGLGRAGAGRVTLPRPTRSGLARGVGSLPLLLSGPAGRPHACRGLQPRRAGEMRGKTCGLVGWTWKNKPIRRKTNKPWASGGTCTHAHAYTVPHGTRGRPATGCHSHVGISRAPHKGQLGMPGHPGIRLYAQRMTDMYPHEFLLTYSL